MGRIKEDICIITSFEDWVHGLRDRGIITTNRMKSIIKGVSVEERQLKEQFNQLSEIDEQLCSLKNKKEELEIYLTEEEIRKVKAKKRK